tara:strand:- start:80 stop:1000 length:921 start_codon:yes stop_codon:yes gene_type:complete
MGVNEIPNIQTNDTSIPFIRVNGTGIPLVQPVGTRTQGIYPIGNRLIGNQRVWLNDVPQSLPIAVPVTEIIGTPIVNMPGCVTIHKENNKRDPSSNKNLVNDDPKGQTTLCDAGAPYYEPPNYDYRELTWQTITQEQPEAGGVDTGTPPAPDLDTPEPPQTGGDTAEEVECPPLNAKRIGDMNQAGTEKVKEYKLTPDGKICETIWEPVPAIEQFLPTVGTVTTTASIAAVATTSALLAKPLADLLLKVVKPIVKKVITKVKTMLGQTPHRPNLSEIQTNQYRVKKGLLPMNFAKKKKTPKKEPSN